MNTQTPETFMTATRKTAAFLLASVLAAGSLWWLSTPRSTQEIVLAPVQGAQR
jgi:hypothetical protein